MDNSVNLRILFMIIFYVTLFPMLLILLVRDSIQSQPVY